MANLDEAHDLLFPGKPGYLTDFTMRQATAISMLSIAKSLEFLVAQMTAMTKITRHDFDHIEGNRKAWGRPPVPWEFKTRALEPDEEWDTQP